MKNQELIWIAIIIISLLYLNIARFKNFTFFSQKPNHHSEIIKVLMNLNEDSLNQLFKLYRESFGKGAANYARRTYQKWKTGKVQPNRRTFERFLVHLPKVMSYDLKCDVLRHFMEEFCSQKEYELNVYTDEWEKSLTPLVEEIINKPYQTELPKDIQNRLEWLSDGEMIAAREILRRSQVEEGKIAVSMLRQEFSNIEKLLAEKQLKPKVTHQLKFPYGTITLNIKRRA